MSARKKCCAACFKSRLATCTLTLHMAAQGHHLAAPQRTSTHNTRRSGADPSTFRVTIPLRELSGVDLEPSVAITVAADAASGRVTFRGERACLGDAALDERFRLTLDAALDARARRRPNRLWRLGLRGRGPGCREAGDRAQGERSGSEGGPVEVAAEAESSWSSGEGASGHTGMQGAQQAGLDGSEHSSGVAHSTLHAAAEELDDAPRPQSADGPAAGGRQVLNKLRTSCLGACKLSTLDLAVHLCSNLLCAKMTQSKRTTLA